MKSPSDRRLFKNLSPVPRRKILEYLQEPSLKKWRDIRDIPVSHGQTLFDVIDLVDRNWIPTYPSMILVARASKLVERRDEELKALEM